MLISRREALRAGLVTTAGGLVVASTPKIYADSWNPIGFRLLGDGWDRFNRGDIIKKALSIVANRFLDNAITLNGYAVDGDSYQLDGELWGITDLNSWFNAKGYRDILIEQLSAIKTLPFERRPAINIWAEYKPDVQAYGWANINRVKVKFSKNGFNIDGEFVISLNTYYVGGGDDYLKDPAFWAGTICHEMLHNLGHLHVKPRSDPDYDRCQLIAHERAVYYGGKYKRGMQRPVVLCGGRWTEPS